MDLLVEQITALHQLLGGEMLEEQIRVLLHSQALAAVALVQWGRMVDLDQE